MTFPNNIPVNYVPPSAATTNPGTQTAPASTSAFKMQGLGALITPQSPIGRVLALVSATVNAAATTDGNGISVQLYYGPITTGGAAPANGAAVPANAVALGTLRNFENAVTLTTAGHLQVPIHLHGIAQGLTAGQQYWFDVAAESITTVSDNALTLPQVDLIEMT